MKKAFLLTMDVFLALILLTLLAMMVISQEYSDKTFSSLYLRTFSMDMLASFEKSGLFAQSLAEPSLLRQTLNNLPANICSQITVTNSTNATVLDVQKEGCGSSGDVYVFHRTFYTEGEVYLAKSRAWLK